MFDENCILRLYANVLREHIIKYQINDQDIRVGVQNMAHIYAPEPTSLQSDSVCVANYNNAAHRCAYLHKYAAFHTALVQHAMQAILQEEWALFKRLITSGDFNLCCLGGGPGSDAIGVLAALNTTFSTFKINVTIVDIMKDWKSTFASLIKELQYGNYGPIQHNFTDNFFQWNYLEENLLSTMSGPVNKAISTANLITMVKFVSAAACKDSENMIKKIFNVMKPGALVLFIDNAAGGFHQLLKKAAYQKHFITVFGPLQHFKYTNEDLNITRFRYPSCYMTTVTIHLLQKPYTNHQVKKRNRNTPSVNQQNENTASDIEICVKPIQNRQLSNSNHNQSQLNRELPKPPSSTYRYTKPPSSTYRPTNPPSPPSSTYRPTNPPSPPSSTYRPTNPPSPPSSTHRPTKPPSSTYRPTVNRPPKSPSSTYRPTVNNRVSNSTSQFNSNRNQSNRVVLAQPSYTHLPSSASRSPIHNRNSNLVAQSEENESGEDCCSCCTIS